MESKFSIQKLNKRVEKYIWQPSTKEGNPLYRKGLDQVSNEQIFTEETKNDAEFKNLIGKKFTSPNNVRALFLFDNLGITVLHHGIGTDIEQNKNTGKIIIKRGSEAGRVLEEHASEKNLIKIGRGKDQAPDKLMFGTISGATTDNQGNSTENFEYEEIDAITDTHKMPIARLNKWQMQNIEEIYFDIMYTLNDLQGKAGDKKIDIKEVVKTIFKVKDIEELKNNYPRLKYIGFVKHTAELNTIIKNRQLVEKIREVQQDKSKSIIEQIPEVKGSIDRENFIELGGNSNRYNDNIADWLYDYLLQQENEKADQQQNKAQKQQEKDLGLRDITGKFISIWEQVGKKLYKEKYPTDKSKDRIFAIAQLPAEEKCYFIQDNNRYYLNTRDIMPTDNKEPLGNGDCMMCLYKNGEPYIEKIGLITDRQLNEYYEEYVVPVVDGRVGELTKKIEELHKKGASFEGIAFYITTNLEKESNIKELCINIYKKANISIPDKMKSLIHLSKYLQNIGIEDFTNEIRNEIKVG